MGTQKDKSDFARKLKSWRERVCISQAEAAEVLHVSKRTYQNWEIERNCPGDLAKATVFMLMRGAENDSKKSN
jgi:DNA-binding transcriptional regulator YiaG